VNCQVYNSVPGEKMPNNLQQPRSQVWFSAGTIIKALIMIIAIGALVFGIINHSILFAQAQRILVPAWQQTQSAQSLNLLSTPTLEIVPTETPLPTATSTPTITPTILPTGTSTALPTATPTATLEPSVLALDTPLGSTIKFIIVRVNPGETLSQIATLHNTTEAAIRTVNFDLPSVLYVDRILVIPIDITDASGLPAFEALEIQQGGMTIEALAVELGVSVEDLYVYNDIQPERIMQAGEWLLVPRD
jgi:LysM repeat protein